MSIPRVMNWGSLQSALCACSVAALPMMLACSGSDASSNAVTPPAAGVGAPGSSAGAPVDTVGTPGPGNVSGATNAPGAADPAPGATSPSEPNGAPPSTEPSAQTNAVPLDPSTSKDPAAGGDPASGNQQAAGEEPGGAAGEGEAAAGDGARVPLDPVLLSRCTGTNPIRCSFDLPNGNYDVSVEVGDEGVAAASRVSAETRHYAGPALATAAGTFAVATFTVNVRAEAHDGGQSAPGNMLDLLIDGDAPKLHGIGIRPAASAATVFIASDSTACDWVSTNTSALAPDETGWGQALSMYLAPGVAVANYADSGETSGSFYGKFFPAARDAMKAGDYLLIQFGHNNKSEADIARYGDDLLRYLADARAKDVTPVIVTPVSRASATAANSGFNGLDQVARDLAAREGVALIDLTRLSQAFYATVPNENSLFIDGTHFHENGAIGVAGVVAEALKESGLGLASFVK